MIYGLGAGILWALETVLLSFVLSEDIFIQSRQAIFLVPFVCAFLNDALSGGLLLIFRRTNKKYRDKNILKVLKKRNGKLLILSGLFGGPLGMGSYLLAIKYIGASYTAVISALYPVLGSVIAWLFLRERLSKKQAAGICLCTVGSVGIIGIPGGGTGNVYYFLLPLACALFWGLEAVISSHAMKKAEVSFEAALQIRQGTSVLCYLLLLLPLLNAWGFTLQVLMQKYILMLLVTAFLETASYLLYYKAISEIGAAKAMSLNITYIVWAVLFSLFFLKEIPGEVEVISMGILLTGVLGVVKYGNMSVAE